MIRIGRFNFFVNGDEFHVKTTGALSQAYDNRFIRCAGLALAARSAATDIFFAHLNMAGQKH